MRPQRNGEVRHGFRQESGRLFKTGEPDSYLVPGLPPRASYDIFSQMEVAMKRVLLEAGLK